MKLIRKAPPRIYNHLLPVSGGSSLSFSSRRASGIIFYINNIKTIIIKFIVSHSITYYIRIFCHSFSMYTGWLHLFMKMCLAIDFLSDQFLYLSITFNFQMYIGISSFQYQWSWQESCITISYLFTTSYEPSILPLWVDLSHWGQKLQLILLEVSPWTVVEQNCAVSLYILISMAIKTNFGCSFSIAF